MKTKWTIFAALFFLANMSFAQITLTANDVLPLGLNLTLVEDTLPAAFITAGAGGQNQTWDFSALDDDLVFSFKTVPAAQTPYADLFPDAEIATIQADSTYGYASKDNNGVYLYGFYGAYQTDVGMIDLGVISDPFETLLRFPTTFNDGFSESFKRVIEFDGSVFGVDSFRIESTVEKTVVYDAYGTLTTPAGTFPVLRVKETETSTDTSYFLFMGVWTTFPSDPITDISYEFWTKQSNIGFPVASIQADALGNTVSASYLQGVTSDAPEETKTISMAVFPNPCQDLLNIEVPYDFGGSLEVYDIMGRKITVEKVDTHFETLNIQELLPGTYMLALKNEANHVVSREKFEVKR